MFVFPFACLWMSMSKNIALLTWCNDFLASFEMIKKAPLGAEPMMCEAISSLCSEEPWFCWARAHSYCGKSVFLRQRSKGPKGDDVPSPHAYRSVSFGGIS